MNIKEAKTQIKNAVTAYLSKDEFGYHQIPIERQRPVFLMGPPGIGKTAVMEQIAEELGVGLVSYSMTHHTRQSALGLPFITKKTYGGKEYDVSEYTMSEIIASVYDMMEESGIREGILFLDEINCVSETLSPAMLQFLQFKIFGRHRVPDGWIVVTAGNPPEYNNSVREFDIVTWDRLKRIDVEPDFDAWKEYAYKKGVHAAIMTYLEIKKDDFYKVETTVDGKRFVTARGWVDLSDMMRLYEQKEIRVDEALICQYLQNPKVAKDFAVYYDLFNKYRADYQVEKVLDGAAPPEVKARAQAARFDERLSLLGLLLETVNEQIRGVVENELMIERLMAALRNVKSALAAPEASLTLLMENESRRLNEELNNRRRAASLSVEEQRIARRLIQAIEAQRELLARADTADREAGFAVLKDDFDRRVRQLQELADAAGARLSNLFLFCEDVFPNGQELLILVTELTVSYYSARFISRYGCEEYFRHNQELLFYERQQEIITELNLLEL